MAVIDVVKYTPEDDSEFVYKFPSNDLRLGTQVIVNEAQEAIFVKGGVALDILTAGTHTLTTGNIPLLNKLINLPFGGDSPFSAEVWFINKTIKRDIKWGTSSPILLRDSLIGLPVNVRSYGRWGLRVTNGRSLLTQITGAKTETTADKLKEYFTGEVIQKLSSVLSAAIVKEKISVLDISAYLNEISRAAHESMRAEFAGYGLEIVNFNIESINLTEEDRVRYQDKFEKSAEVLAAQANNVDYRTVKSFEILQKAAENEAAGNALGGMLGAGIGFGAGFPLGHELSKNMSVNVASAQSSAQDPMERLRKLKNMYNEGLITEEQFKEKQSEILKEV